MSDRKLILPTELKVCATCTYWDGERAIDDETRVVVVIESCHGECLASENPMPALAAADPAAECLWDRIHCDEMLPDADGAEPKAGED